MVVWREGLEGRCADLEEELTLRGGEHFVVGTFHDGGRVGVGAKLGHVPLREGGGAYVTRADARGCARVRWCRDTWVLPWCGIGVEGASMYSTAYCSARTLNCFNNCLRSGPRHATRSFFTCGGLWNRRVIGCNVVRRGRGYNEAKTHHKSAVRCFTQSHQGGGECLSSNKTALIAGKPIGMARTGEITAHAGRAWGPDQMAALLALQCCGDQL